MLSGGDKKYDIGSGHLPPSETNFVLQATMNFMNGPYVTDTTSYPLDLF